MATSTDYDAPRTILTADDSIEDLQAGHGAPEELTVAVVPMMADEFRCTRCFLVSHRSQQATAGQELCRDCS